MKILVTGGAGFIGSNLVPRLIKENHQVTVIDNLSLGKKEYLAEFLNHPDFSFYQEDLLDAGKVTEIFKNHHFDLVIHLAANSDIITSATNPEIDLHQGTLATFNVLESMRLSGVKEIIFASSSVIYGQAKVKPTTEDYGPLLPISFYGANKLAAEGLISSYCHIFGWKSWLFRFANVIGRHGTHGVFVDFIKKLRKNNKELQILGNGQQCKPYLYINDCLDGMMHGYQRSKETVNYFNLTSQGRTKVCEIAELITRAMGLKDVKFNYTGGHQGWPGDISEFELSGEKLKKLGWQAKYDSHQAAELAIRDLLMEI